MESRQSAVVRLPASVTQLRFMGSCCGDYTGKAGCRCVLQGESVRRVSWILVLHVLQLSGDPAGAAEQVQSSINTNELYGKTEEIAGSIFKDSGCTPVVGDSMKSNATAGCNYFSVFENTAHADHEYAANCVPATTCKENVVGMTQGMIALYGVVMQILQQNLGSLAWIGEGDMASCYAGMNKANMGSLDDIIVHKPIKIGPIQIGTEKVLEFEGMKKLGATETLSKCKDRPHAGVGGGGGLFTIERSALVP